MGCQWSHADVACRLACLRLRLPRRRHVSLRFETGSPIVSKAVGVSSRWCRTHAVSECRSFCELDGMSTCGQADVLGLQRALEPTGDRETRDSDELGTSMDFEMGLQVTPPSLSDILPVLFPPRPLPWPPSCCGSQRGCAGCPSRSPSNGSPGTATPSRPFPPTPRPWTLCEKNSGRRLSSN